MAEDDRKMADTPAARAIRLAIERQNTDAVQTLDERAADVLRSSVVEQTAEEDRRQTRREVIATHIGCAVLTVVSVVLKVTLLSKWPALGELLLEGALFVWGLAGFKPREAVLAHVIAKLEPKRLDRMLSLRPPAAGNSLYPPPPAAMYPGTMREVKIPKAPPASSS